MKILLDINLTPKWREPLERLGHEVKHWSEIGEASASDAIIMEYARRNNFVVFTNDLDYGALLYSTAALSPSVIQARGDDVRPSSLIPAVTRALSEAELELRAGALVTVDTRKHRVSILPIRRK